MKIINRNKHPYLDKIFFEEMVAELKPLEIQNLLDCLDNTELDTVSEREEEFYNKVEKIVEDLDNENFHDAISIKEAVEKLKGLLE